MDFQQIRDFVNPAVAQATGIEPVDNLSMPVPVAYVPVQLVIDGALSPTSENPVQNKVIAVAIQNLDGRITAIEGQFSEGVTEAVNNWLDAHPEATTTVQDGAITYAKLDANLKGEVDQISALETKLVPLFSHTVKVEQGYYAITNGIPTNSAAWCRTSTEVPNNIVISIEDYSMFLLAYDVYTKNYIGTWDGTAFVKTYNYGTQAKKVFNLVDFAANYPTYVYKIIFFNNSDDLTVENVLQKCTIKFPQDLFPEKLAEKQDKLCSNLIGNVFEYLYPVTLQTGQYLTFSTSDGDPIGAQVNVNFYDTFKQLITYYGFAANLSSRTVGPISSDIANAKYIALTGYAPRVPIMINVGQAKLPYEEYFLPLPVLTEKVESGNNNTNIHEAELEKVYALKKHYGGGGSADNTFKALWCSDIHQEIIRTNRMVELLNTWGSDYFDVAINTGDTVATVFGDQIAWYDNAINDSNIPVLNTIGNHDAWASLDGTIANQVSVYQKFIAPVAEKTTIVQPQDAATLGLNYYYKDVGGIRVIVLDCMYWDSAELSWFTTVLDDARTNSLPVIACSHAPFELQYCQLVDSIWNVGTFVRDSTKTNIDAATAVKNFMDNGGTFVCWLMGHIHGDELETLPNYGDQVVVCTNSFQDRGTTVIKNTDQNAYNYDCLMFLTVDTERKTVKFYRIGANIDVAGHKRNGLIWNYSAHSLVTEW